MTLRSGDQLNSFSEIGAMVCQPCWCFEHQNYHLTMVLLNTRQGVRLDQNDGITIVRWQTSNGAQHQNGPFDFEARRLTGGCRLVGTVTATEKYSHSTNTVTNTDMYKYKYRSVGTNTVTNMAQIPTQMKIQIQTQISRRGYCQVEINTLLEV